LKTQKFQLGKYVIIKFIIEKCVRRMIHIRSAIRLLNCKLLSKSYAISYKSSNIVSLSVYIFYL